MLAPNSGFARPWPLIFILLMLTASVSPGNAPSFRLHEIGFRAGGGIGKDNDFTQYEGFTTLSTPWGWTNDSGRLQVDLEAQTAIGALSHPDTTAAFIYAGPGLRLSSPVFPVYLTAGSSPAYLTRSQFGDVNLGQRLQFVSSAALTLMLTPEIGLRYRVQHMSNARMARPNPGINTHSAGIVIAF